MSPLSMFAVVATFLVFWLPAVSHAQTELTGQTESGAYYKIQVPDGWQAADGLVIWNHGFSFDPVAPVEDMGPLAPLQLSEGYAVAASSYSLSGWALFQTADDNRQMVEAFEDAFGVPEQVLIYGASLGGLVTAQAVEQGDLGNVVGAYPFCGALAGSRIWDAGLDLRLFYDFVCGEVPGAAIPGGATGIDPTAGLDQEAVATALNVCTGVLVPPELRTPEQTTRLDRLLQLSGLPEEFLLTDMIFVTFGLADLIFDPAKLGGGQALGNDRVDYGDVEVDAGIERVMANPEARVHLRHNYTPSGRVGGVKIVSIHTDKDGLVIIENESDYAAKVPAGQLTTAVVIEDEPTHCGFTPAELVAGWEVLRGWVAGAPRPNPGQLLAVCQGLETGGLAEGPCRFDPGYAIPDLSGRVRQRDICQSGGDTMCLNDARFRLELEWTDFEGNTGAGRLVDAATSDSGLFWFFGPNNWEMLVKVLDGCAINGHYWVFSAAATNVAYELTVTDTDTGVTRSYTNPLGRTADALTDTEAFATCP